MRVDNHTYYYFSTDGNILRHFAILGQYGTIVNNILLARVNYVPTLFFVNPCRDRRSWSYIFLKIVFTNTIVLALT